MCTGEPVEHLGGQLPHRSNRRVVHAAVLGPVQFEALPQRTRKKRPRDIVIGIGIQRQNDLQSVEDAKMRGDSGLRAFLEQGRDGESMVGTDRLNVPAIDTFSC